MTDVDRRSAGRLMASNQLISFIQKFDFHKIWWLGISKVNWNFVYD